jgi:nicotinamidase-related amidase
MPHSNIISLPRDRTPRQAPPLLLLVDLQREYSTDGRRYYIRDIAPALGNCAKLLRTAQQNRWPIAKTRLLQRGDHFNPKVQFSNWMEAFRPQASDMIFERSEPSCFSNTSFAEMMGHGAGDVVVLAGFTGTVACLSTAIDGATRGHKVIFVSDASASLGDASVSEHEAHAHATFVISQHASVAATDAIIGAFSDSADWLENGIGA